MPKSPVSEEVRKKFVDAVNEASILTPHLRNALLERMDKGGFSEEEAQNLLVRHSSEEKQRKAADYYKTYGDTPTVRAFRH